MLVSAEVAQSRNNSWSELLASAPAAKGGICRDFTLPIEGLVDCEQSCTASLPVACHC